MVAKDMEDLLLQLPPVSKVPQNMHDTSLDAQHTTLTDCESERLHLSGKIQGFGALIVVRLSDWIITHASDNADSFLGSGIDQCLGTDVRTVGFWSLGWADRIPQTHGERSELMDGPWVFTLIRSGDYLLIECEPIGTVSPPIPIHQLHRGLIRPPTLPLSLPHTRKPWYSICWRSPA